MVVSVVFSVLSHMAAADAAIARYGTAVLALIALGILLFVRARRDLAFVAVVIAAPVVGWAVAWPPTPDPPLPLVLIVGVLAATTVGLFVVPYRRERQQVAAAAAAYLCAAWLWFALAYYVGGASGAVAFGLGQPVMSAPDVTPSIVTALYLAAHGFVGGNFGEYWPKNDGAQLFATLELATLLIITLWLVGLAPWHAQRDRQDQRAGADAPQPEQHVGEKRDHTDVTAIQTPALATGEAPPAIDLVWSEAQRNLAEQHRRFGDLDAKLLPLLAFNVAGIAAANASNARYGADLALMLTVLFAASIAAALWAAWPRRVQVVPSLASFIEDAAWEPARLKERYLANYREAVYDNEKVLKGKVDMLKFAFAGAITAVGLFVAAQAWLT